MDFKTAAILGSYISKDYAERIFKLLVSYENISASEAASRLNMHIKTAQDFLDAMAELDILSKEEVYERKRPYYRYSLKKHRIVMDIDLDSLYEKPKSDGKLAIKIRERKNANVRFSIARNNQYISNVVIWTGEGRNQKERKINLTMPQGKFLFNLPFPSAKYMSISDIMKKAQVDKSNSSEILDIVNVLIKYKVIEEYK